MALLVLLCAALVATAASYAIPPAKNVRVRQLAVAYWIAFAALCVAGIADYGRGEERLFGVFLHFDHLAEHAAMGVLVVAAILVAWSIFCLFGGFGRSGEDQ